MMVPDLAELVALRAAAHGLNLRAHRPALARFQGGHRGAQRGRGLEFEEVRPYAEGDDKRSIDWRVTARRGRPYTKVFREDRERPVWLLVDLHSGLFFGSRRQLKSALMLRAAAVLAWTGGLSGDRVGAVIVGGPGGPRIYPPRGRHAGVLPILQCLVESQPRAPAVPEGGTLNAALETLRPLARPGSLVMILSDFTGLNSNSDSLFAAVAARVDCRLIWITDPIERSGLPSGEFRVGLPGNLRWLDGARSRPAWQAAWAERERRILELSRHQQLPLTRLDTPDAVDQVVPALLRERTWAA